MKSSLRNNSFPVVDALPTVDIVIAGINEERHLGSCLQALQAQDYPSEKLQIYFVDNGSTDGTIEVARRHGVGVLQQPRRGAAAARNLGIKSGDGELVGFLDAHCIPDQSWVRHMSAAFTGAEIGGCQSDIVHRSDNPKIEHYFNASGAFAVARIWEDTISGKRNIYPWMPSGHCMYRRQALEAAQLFNENLPACEDVDLSWRVVLLGYRFRYVPVARVVHYDGNSWRGFLKRSLKYGGMAAVLAAIYRPHGASNKFLPDKLWVSNLECSLPRLCYWAGYQLKDFRLRSGLEAAPSLLKQQPVLARFRPRFHWTPEVQLQISDEAVFWLRDEHMDGEPHSVIVHIPTKSRIVLESTGDFAWRRLAKGENRTTVMQAMAEYYEASPDTIGPDLDELIEELVAAQVLVSHAAHARLARTV